MIQQNLLTVLDEIGKRRNCRDIQSLARLLGVAPSTLSHYRSGSRKPSLDRIETMAVLLDADPYEVTCFVRGSAVAA